MSNPIAPRAPSPRTAKPRTPTVDPALTENLEELIRIAREIGASDVYLTRHAASTHIHSQHSFGPGSAQWHTYTDAPLILHLAFDQVDHADLPGTFIVTERPIQVEP